MKNAGANIPEADYRPLNSRIIWLLPLILLCGLALPAGVLATGDPAIELVKTISDDGSCGVVDELAAGWHTPITYCYTVTNTGNVTFTSQTLTDTVLGPLLLDFAYALPPGASTFITATYDLPNIYGEIVNCALWTAADETGATAEAEDCATVYVLAPTDVGLSSFGAEARPGSWWIALAGALGVVVTGRVLLRRRRGEQR